MTNTITNKKISLVAFSFFLLLVCNLFAKDDENKKSSLKLKNLQVKNLVMIRQEPMVEKKKLLPPVRNLEMSLLPHEEIFKDIVDTETLKNALKNIDLTRPPLQGQLKINF